MGLEEGPIQVHRGRFIESTHDIHIAIVNSNGDLKYSYGDPFRPTFARSAMKPFQAVPLVESNAAENFSFEPADIALCCASHSGEEIHRLRVKALLERIHEPENVLQCGTHVPRDRESYKQLIREGRELTPVYSNCSGKHTGMIATCLHLGESIENYRESEHPHQQRILHAIANICNYQENDIGIGTDGCGLPAHRLPLQHIALGFAHLARPDLMHGKNYSNSLETIRDAMMAHPEMVAGTNRFDTDLMHAFNGQIVSKMGAEGMQCIGLVDSGLGIAIKAEDGNERAAYVAAMRVLEQLKIGSKETHENLHTFTEPMIKNMSGESIGKITANFMLHEVK